MMKNLSIKKHLISATKGITTLAVLFCLSALPLMASSHAEAPLTSMDRYADNTDVYAFRSTEAGRENFVTLIANFIPFQDPSGGPQFYRFDDTVLYEIKVDNTGDGVPDVTYQFRFKTNIVRDSTVLGHTTFNQDGVVNSLTDPDFNMQQTYTVTRLSGTSVDGSLTNLQTPPSNVGPRVTPNYETNLAIPAIFNCPPGCVPGGERVFAGQRDEGFFIDVGGVFDLLNLRTLGASGGVDTLRGFNVNTIAIEVPIIELTRGRTMPASSTASNAVIGVWSTASRQTTRVIGTNGTQTNSGNFQQISRLGNPLVNELIIPLALKDAFNSLQPTGDAVAAPAIQDPELARLMQLAFGIAIPPPPRNDLVTIFATGIPAGAVPGLPNYTTFLSDGQPHEFMRLNVAIPPTANPSRLGLLGNDPAGFPNGRRVFDDVVDIELRAMAGGTPFTPAQNVSPNNTIGDGVSTNEQPFLTRFPYLASPNQGNQVRPSNSPAQKPNEGKALPFVDRNGKFVSK